MPAFFIVIIICFVASLLSLTVKKNRPKLKFFPFLLLVTFIFEMVGLYMSRSNQHNVWVYNFLTFFEFGFYLLFLNAVIKDFYKRNLIFYIIIFYLVLTFLNIIFVQGITQFHTYTYILGCLLTAALCIVYFNILFRYTKSSALIKEPEFWIVTALLFFHTFSLPLFGILNFIANIPLRFQNMLLSIINFMNIMLYLLFTIGFLCRIDIRKLLR